MSDPFDENPPLGTVAWWSPRLPILIGQEPKSNDPNIPLDPSDPRWSGARLARMAGLEPEVFVRRFLRVNVNYLPSPEGKFRVNDITRAKARRMAQVFQDGDRVVFLGKDVARCFTGLLPMMRPWDEYPIEHAELVTRQKRITFWMVPHPSGVNRIYNDPTNVANVGRFLRSLIDERD